MRIRKTAIAALVLAGIMATAQARAEPTPKNGGSLKVGVASTRVTEGLDPHVIQGDTTVWALSQMAEGLLHFDENMNVVPWLAREWTISEDGLTYTFLLQEGVLFHNGREMTAEDVKFSLERILDPDTGSRRRQNLEQIESIAVIDDYTVAIRLSTSFAPFLSNLVGVWAAIIPRESIAENGSITAPVGTGPFAFTDYAMNENLTLRRFDDYWRPNLPYLDEVSLMPISDDAARMVALRTGAVDLITSVPAQLLPSLMANADRGFELLVSPGTLWRMAIMNNTRPPFDDVRVRQAVNLAVDREETMLARTFGFGTVENQIWDQESFWRMNAEIPQRNVEKARELLAEAGYPDGLPITIEARSTYLDDAQVVQGHLNEAGFDARIAVSDWAVLSDRMRAGEYDMAISAAGWYADPDGRYGRFYTPDGPANYFAGGYENAEVTELLAQGREEVDPTKRKVIYQQIFDIIQVEVPHVMLYFSPNTMAWRPEVKGFRTDRQGGLSNADTGLAYVWLDR